MRLAITNYQNVLKRGDKKNATKTFCKQKVEQLNSQQHISGIKRELLKK